MREEGELEDEAPAEVGLVALTMEVNSEILLPVQLPVLCTLDLLFRRRLQLLLLLLLLPPGPVVASVDAVVAVAARKAVHGIRDAPRPPVAVVVVVVQSAAAVAFVLPLKEGFLFDD